MLGKKLKAKTTNLARGGATMATVPIGKEAVENSIYRQSRANKRRPNHITRH